MQDVVDLALKMSETVDLADDAEVEKFNKTGFNEVGDMFLAVREGPRDFLPLMKETVHIIGPRGKVPLTPHEQNVNVIFGGTPHHIQGAFGYWHINDVDEVSIIHVGPEPEPFKVFLIMRVPRPGERDMFAWYCPECLNLLHGEAYPSGDRMSEGWDGILRAERHAVDTFNADPSLRVCKECGTEHPLAYGFQSPWCTPDEELVRWSW